MKLQNNIKMEIIKNGYKSVKDFSDQNGLSYYMVRKLVNSEANSIDIELLVGLCKALNCKVGDLFYISEETKMG